jgi:hypothetical protein
MNQSDKLLLTFKSKIPTKTAISFLLAVTGKQLLKLKERIKNLLTEKIPLYLNSQNNANVNQNFKENKTFYQSLLKDQPNHLKKPISSMLIPSLKK